MSRVLRTTGGLLELQKKSFTRADFEGALRTVERLGLGRATLNALGHSAVKRYLAKPPTSASAQPASVAAPRETLEVDLDTFERC